MKHGFSLLLQEYVDPKEVEYEDTRIFQIVCPSCKEPVFKVDRKDSVHYFSHYKKDETLIKQCELRVNNLSGSDIKQQNFESKNQKLALFLQVFQDIIWDNEYDDLSRKKAKRLFFLLQKSKSFSSFLVHTLHNYRSISDDKNEMLDYFDESIDNVKYDFLKTPFSINLQKDYAYSFLQHLLSGNTKKNYFFLMIHGFIKYYLELQQKMKNTYVDWELELYNNLNNFFNTQNDKKHKKIFNKLCNIEIISPYTDEIIDLFSYLGSQMSYYAFGFLLKIPYLKLIQKS
jgi:hypothetical protein